MKQTLNRLARRTEHAWRALLFAACTLSAAACSFGEEFEAADCPADGTGDVSYVSLNIVPTAGPSTRSNPTGGKDGDGREPGQSYENDVTTVTAFLFVSDKGINAPAATPIAAVMQFYSLTQQSDASDPYSHAYRTETLPVNVPDGTYQVLAVANGGDMTWATSPTTPLTLGDVRDHTYNGAAWQESGDDYSQFVMASAADATLTLEGNAADEPATAAIDVERLAARVDYQTQGSYTCAADATSPGTVVIEGAVLVNNMTAGSYLFKRTADDAAGTNLRYLGEETVTPDDVATNYVIDPWTSQKTPEMGGLPDQLYGLRLGSYQTSAEWPNVVVPGTPVKDAASGEEWMRIGYTLENTADRTAEPRQYATGVVFRARFTPADDTVVGNYTAGRTFFRWNGALYATCRDIMEAYWEKRAAVANAEEAVMACTTWGELRTVANDGLRAGDPTGYVAWLRSCVDGHGNDEDQLINSSEYIWTNYMRTVCGYATDADGRVTIDGNGKNTRELLAAHNVQTYRDATCYYTYWIRHGGDEGSDATMERAIVRNNIYKLSVDGVYDLGDDLPGETPLVVTVYVNNWTLLPSETLPL